MTESIVVQFGKIGGGYNGESTLSSVTKSRWRCEEVKVLQKVYGNAKKSRTGGGAYQAAFEVILELSGGGGGR